MLDVAVVYGMLTSTLAGLFFEASANVESVKDFAGPAL
jgi:hypothetical protein